MKATYDAWAVQVLRDGEWVIESLDCLAYSKTTAEHLSVAVADCGEEFRVRKVRVTVEEV